MNVQFIAGIAVIAADPAESRKLYVGSLGLPLEASEGSDYFHSERIGGSKHFAVWPLSQAAQACFGREEWPSDRPVPQASIEFEVEDADAVQAGAEELRRDGFALLHDARTEPWGQTARSASATAEESERSDAGALRGEQASERSVWRDTPTGPVCGSWPAEGRPRFLSSGRGAIAQIDRVTPLRTHDEPGVGTLKS